jgi:hypothetical protein
MPSQAFARQEGPGTRRVLWCAVPIRKSLASVGANAGSMLGARTVGLAGGLAVADPLSRAARPGVAAAGIGSSE